MPCSSSYLDLASNGVLALNRRQTCTSSNRLNVCSRCCFSLLCVQISSILGGELFVDTEGSGVAQMQVRCLFVSVCSPQYSLDMLSSKVKIRV